MRPGLNILLCLLVLPGLTSAQNHSYAPKEIAKEIFRLTNLERTARGLRPLEYHAQLEALAELQSRNMLEYSFFSHTDHKGRSVHERKDEYFPKLFGGMGENIAYIQGIPASKLARKFVKIWMNSAGHRKNILHRDFSHFGVGVARKAGEYSATQVFGALVAEMVSDVDDSYRFGSEHGFKFRFLGKFPRQKITIFVHFPDKTARFFTKKNLYYTGVGHYKPIWLDHNTFRIKVKFDKGRGRYNLTMGSYGSYVPGGLDLVVK
ncbi:MAG: CAP domain-containing protein [bacterium]